PVIAVAINYRLAAWGWLYSEEVVQEGSTNVGLRIRGQGKLRSISNQNSRCYRLAM
ncbi:hypothetical protein BKA56DRAFT_484892, partial [Ilyonectria sp. MPI-CAGE-AT-0026]